MLIFSFKLHKDKSAAITQKKKKKTLHAAVSYLYNFFTLP